MGLSFPHAALYSTGVCWSLCLAPFCMRAMAFLLFHSATLCSSKIVLWSHVHASGALQTKVF